MCAPLNPDCEKCPLAGDCLAYAEATLVSEGKPVEYDMEDLGGCSHSTFIGDADSRYMWIMSTV